MFWLLVMLVIGIVVGRLSYRYNAADVTRESRGGGLFVIALAVLPLLAACGGGDDGDGGGGSAETVSPPDPAASTSGSGDLCNLALLFVASPDTACGRSSSSSSDASSGAAASPIPVTPAPPVTITLHRSAELEPNNDIINANIPEFAVIPGRVGFVVDGAISDSGDTEDAFAFVRPHSMDFVMQLCPPGEATCTSVRDMPIDVGTAFIELLDADGQVLMSGADLETNILETRIDAGVQYYLRVVAADTMSSAVGYDLTAHEAP
ncbi:MAG: hypothetical protein AAFX10_02470 [Pseudomonadota bacterium]